MLRADRTTSRLQRVVPVAVASAAVPVVRPEPPAIALVAYERIVELGRILDLVLRAIDEDLLLVVVGVPNHSGRKHDLFAEDPRTGVDNDVRRPSVVRRFVDLADRTVQRFDAVADDVRPTRRCAERRVPIRPYISVLHETSS